MLRKIIVGAANVLDETYHALTADKPHLLSLIFHKLFADRAEMQDVGGMPMEAVTVSDFQTILDILATMQYTFASPDDLQNPVFLEKNKKIAFITFDDGYLNNFRALAVLEKYKTPALFNITTSYTENERPYWWDILYAERSKRSSEEKILQEVELIKKKTPFANAWEYIFAEFGKRAEVFQNELHRPMTIGELSEFSQSPYVFLGNHTHNHAALAFHDEKSTHFEIEKAQILLQNWTNKKISVMSYPHGSFRTESLQIAEKFNLKTGLSIDNIKNYLPLQSEEKKILGRFSFDGLREKPEISLERAIKSRPERPFESALYSFVKKIKS